jgi:hypothetical protein
MRRSFCVAHDAWDRSVSNEVLHMKPLELEGGRRASPNSNTADSAVQNSLLHIQLNVSIYRLKVVRNASGGTSYSRFTLSNESKLRSSVELIYGRMIKIENCIKN